MAQAPDGNDTLTPDDAAKILEELLDAQNSAKLLGLMLNIKLRDAEAIINSYKHPKEQLLHIILAFLQQAELRPTWRAIVDALRSPVVGLTALAEKIESNHFPNATASPLAQIKETLDVSDAAKIAEELLEAQSHAFVFGLALKVKPSDLEAIENMHVDPKDRLAHTISAILLAGQAGWREFIGALQTIGLTTLAAKVEAAHLPDLDILSREKENLELLLYLLSHYSETSQANRQLYYDTLRNKKWPGGLATAVPHYISPAQSRMLTVECRNGIDTPIDYHKPHGMVARGSATTDGKFAYFTQLSCYSELFTYEFSTRKWGELPQCPYLASGLVIINGELTTVGGAGEVNQLMTLRQGKWMEVYPPMMIKRSSPAVVTTADGNYVFVIGGVDPRNLNRFNNYSNIVEILQVSTRKWCQATDLPYYPWPPQATISGEWLSVICSGIGGCFCSIKGLPSGDELIAEQLNLTWVPLPLLPLCEATIVTVCGQLVIFGGQQDMHKVDSIHQLVDGKWVKIGSMANKRQICLAVSPSPYKVVLIGGHDSNNLVEECIAVLNT